LTGVLVDDLVARLDQLLGDHAQREQLDTKAQVRSGEFSWRLSADAMRTVLDAVVDGRRVSGLV
jgi:hypothetical protein